MRRAAHSGVGPRLAGEASRFGIQTQGLRNRVRQPLAQGFLRQQDARRESSSMKASRSAG